MTYSESAEGQMITINRAMEEAANHGMIPDTIDWREFEADVANLQTPDSGPLVPAAEVLHILGY